MECLLVIISCMIFYLSTTKDFPKKTRQDGFGYTGMDSLKRTNHDTIRYYLGVLEYRSLSSYCIYILLEWNTFM